MTAPLSSPPVVSRPPAGGDPHVLLRTQILTDTACAFARSTGPATVVLREMLRVRSVLDREIVAVLLIAAYRDEDRLALLCEDVWAARWAMERHEESDVEHGSCCDHECRCAGGGPRCDRCDAIPVERLDDAVRSLRHWLERIVGERAVTEMCGAA